MRDFLKQLNNNKMKKLLYKINGINYLLMELPFNKESQDILNLFCDKAIEFNGIIQSAEKVSGGFWGNSYVKVSVLIPEDQAYRFSSYRISE